MQEEHLGIKSNVVSKIFAFRTEDPSSVPRTNISKAKCDGVLKISVLGKETWGRLESLGTEK